MAILRTRPGGVEEAYRRFAFIRNDWADQSSPKENLRPIFARTSRKSRSEGKVDLCVDQDII